MALVLKKPVAQLHKKEQHISLRKNLHTKARKSLGRRTCKK